MCKDCYFDIHSPTKTNDQPWLHQIAPRIASEKGRTYDSKLAQTVIQGNYNVDSVSNQIQIDDVHFQFTVKGLDKIAMITGILVGKWLIYRNISEIDQTWKKIALAVKDGVLGVSTKVSTAMQESKRYVICVYTADYLDKSDVQKNRFHLKTLGINEHLCYKPDLYTYLNLYSGPSKISPCRYRS